jgi:hypothetical protein
MAPTPTIHRQPNEFCPYARTDSSGVLTPPQWPVVVAALAQHRLPKKR